MESKMLLLSTIFRKLDRHVKKNCVPWLKNYFPRSEQLTRNFIQLMKRVTPKALHFWNIKIQRMPKKLWNRWTIIGWISHIRFRWICLRIFKSKFCCLWSEKSIQCFVLFRYEHIPEKWEPPTPQPYKVQTDLYNYLIEPDGYDQYCVAAETAPNAIQVQFWQNTLPEPMELETRDVSWLTDF